MSSGSSSMMRIVWVISPAFAGVPLFFLVMMADVPPLGGVDDLFRDVGGMVSHALEVPGDEDQRERARDRRGIGHHVGQELPEDLFLEGIDLVVGIQDLLRQDR